MQRLRFHHDPRPTLSFSINSALDSNPLSIIQSLLLEYLYLDDHLKNSASPANYMAWMLSLKVVAISAAVVFTALGVKATVPLVTAHLLPLWNMCLLCFKPPFLYLLLNAIIISIVASSRCFHRNSFDTAPPPPTPQPPLLHVNPVLVDASVSPSALEDQEEQEEEEEEEKAIDLGVVVDSVEESTLTSLKSMDSTEIPPEYLSPTGKPLVSARFGHRKPPKSTPEGGKALRVVVKPKRQETLENTWKAITEGRAMPLSRHMRKCDTWQNRGSAGPQHEMKKSETFKERTNQQLAPDSVSVSVSDGIGRGGLRREPSLSQDELNRRVEAFIRKFNEQMRLQRQESLNQYMQMINRDAD